jgi:hypothetical protein
MALTHPLEPEVFGSVAILEPAQRVDGEWMGTPNAEAVLNKKLLRVPQR